MIIISSKHNVPIRLSRERWKHIKRRHPEIKDEKEKILDTLKDPDIIQEGDYMENCWQ